MTADGGGGVTPAVTGEELVAAVPQLAALAEIEVVQFRQKPSCHLGLSDCTALARAIETAGAAGARGIVVTQGTDTIEETAFALDLLISGGPPVVITGAMRNPRQPGADGPANLLAAAQAALSPVCRGLGVLVCLNDKIHAARHVIKGDTQNPDAFTSGVHGILGRVLEGRISLVNPVPWTRAGPLSNLEGEVAYVPLIKAFIGDDGRLIRAASSEGCKGLVVEAMGAGHLPPAMADALTDLAQDMPVLLCSRVWSGEIFASTYGYVGGEMDLLKRGLIHGGWLDGLKARVLLALALTAGSSRETIVTGLHCYGGIKPEVS